MDILFDIAQLWAEGEPGQVPVRALFAAAGVGMLVVEQPGEAVVEANPAALALLDLPAHRLVRRHWLEAFSPASARRLAAHCPRGGPPPARVTVPVEAAAGDRRLLASITSFQSGGRTYLLVRLEAAAKAGAAPAGAAEDVLARLEQFPGAFAVTDEGLRVEYGNRAFLALVGARSPGEVLGRSLAHWFALSGADLDALDRQMARREATLTLLATLHEAGGASSRVELVSVAVPDGPARQWGFTFRRLDGDGAVAPQVH